MSTPQSNHCMRHVLQQMLQGFIIHERSWDSEAEDYKLDMMEAMTEACGGNVLQGRLLYLFSHWSNDIINEAAHLGLRIGVVGDKSVVLNDVPPAPSLNHWWDNDHWEAPVA